jgi:tetratricopeptide (TPR) repeat protein
LETDDFRIFLHRGTTLLKLQQYEDAMRYFQQSVQMSPNNDTANYRMGVALFE